MGSLNYRIPDFLPKVVDFSNGKSYEIVKPLTDFRKCHDGKPLEARVVFTCKQVGSELSQHDEEEFVVKVKVQVPDIKDDFEQHAVAGPSTTTAAEVKALEAFTKSENTHAPHLVAFKKAVQGADGLFPGGFLTFTVMTKMPGQDLLAAQFWSMKEDVRQEIVQEFLKALRSIYNLGIEPVDCALRNVLWEAETKRCTIIDFELWREATEVFADEKKELERWGLAKRKAPISWWAEWNHQGR